MSQNLLELRPNTVEYVRNLYNLGDENKIEEAIDLLENWAQKQNHFLKRHFPRKYLESLIIANKGSIERAKSKLDKLCTLRTILPQFFAFSDIKTDFKNLFLSMTLVPLPTLDENHCRVFSLRPMENEYFRVTPYMQYYIFLCIYLEYIKMYDYSNGIVIIVDYRNINVMDIVTRLNPMELKQLVTLVLEGYGARVQGIHVVTPSRAVETLLKIVKPLFGAKVAERVRVHSSIDTLYETVPKDILPEEYGGHQGSLKDLQDNWINLLSSKESIEFFNEIREAGVNQSYRLSSKLNEDLGMQGSFRYLALD